VKVPALFLLGARDAMTPARAGRDLARAVPNSTVVTLASAATTSWAKSRTKSSIRWSNFFRA